ncbi:septum formation initiator family protein [Paraflavisolibacter sp. H34]|uniref:FtsB family cell division protein n=1 Tax=Huijunlia imazamoxiresistens TaxID=3127457 RepID=UPI003018799D
MRFLSFLRTYLGNKYILASTAFVVWLLFFDRNDVLTQFERQGELEELQESKQYYADQIKQERQSLEELRSNPITIEKYARERYGMKRDNEDVFIIQKAGE